MRNSRSSCKALSADQGKKGAPLGAAACRGAGLAGWERAVVCPRLGKGFLRGAWLCLSCNAVILLLWEEALLRASTEVYFGVFASLHAALMEAKGKGVRLVLKLCARDAS